jgi:hypothetical protein
MHELRKSGLHISVSARERDSEHWERTLSDFLQPMIDWIAESAARERAARDSNK